MDAPNRHNLLEKLSRYRWESVLFLLERGRNQFESKYRCPHPQALHTVEGVALYPIAVFALLIGSWINSQLFVADVSLSCIFNEVLKTYDYEECAGFQRQDSIRTI